MKLSLSDLEKIAHYENKRGIQYAKCGGKLYNGFFVFGFLSWIFMMTMSFLYVIGNLLGLSSMTNLRDSDFIAVVTSFAVILSSMLFYAFKLRLTAFAINMVSVPVMALGFINKTRVGGNYSSSSGISEYDSGFLGLKKIFFWRHGIPMLIVFTVCIILSAIIIRERIIVKKEFDKISENEYKSQIVTEDE